MKNEKRFSNERRSLLYLYFFDGGKLHLLSQLRAVKMNLIYDLISEYAYSVQCNKK